MIIYENNKPHYFDKNGKEITDGYTIRYADGRTEKVYRTTDDQLGTDATNPSWIKSGRAVPCEYGLYPLGSLETDEIEVVEEGRGEGQFNGAVARIRVAYPPGTRLELVKMDDAFAPPAGTIGTVVAVDDAGDLCMEWSTGSTLKVILGEDIVKKIDGDN